MKSPTSLTSLIAHLIVCPYLLREANFSSPDNADPVQATRLQYVGRDKNALRFVDEHGDFVCLPLATSHSPNEVTFTFKETHFIFQQGMQRISFFYRDRT